jgi:hypothetical protein
MGSQGDFLLFLHAAKDVVNVGGDTRNGVSFTRYRFALDGPSFGTALRGELQRQVAGGTTLPAATMDNLPTQYKQMAGTGEVWVGANGLPLRQILHIQMPGESGSRVQADVTVDFSHWGLGTVTGSLSSPLALLWPIGEHKTALASLMLCLMLAYALVALARSEPIYAAIATLVIATLVGVPLIQGAQAAAMSDQAARDARAKQQQATVEQSRDL